MRQTLYTCDWCGATAIEGVDPPGSWRQQRPPDRGLPSEDICNECVKAIRQSMLCSYNTVRRQRMAQRGVVAEEIK